MNRSHVHPSSFILHPSFILHRWLRNSPVSFVDTTLHARDITPSSCCWTAAWRS
ncbi:MAG: hypothetical protein ACXW28_09670 [Thermoanaerobaculia bacterium]